LTKNFKVLIIFLGSTLFGLFLWELIEFPLNEDKLNKSFDYIENFYNPLNDPVKFIILLTIPFIFLAIFYQKNDGTFLKNLHSIIFFNKKMNSFINLNSKDLNFYFIIIVTILLIEFFCLDFKNFNYLIDVFHEGMWLSASQNLNIKGDYWLSSYVVRGFFADFYPYFLWNIFGNETIGVTRFFQLFVLLLNKVLILLILRKICLFTNFSKDKLKLFFVSLSILILSLQGYISPIFSFRSFLLLLFILVFLNFLQKYNRNIVLIFFLGLFSSLSSFWFIDIALYINVILILLIFYFFIKLEFKNLCILVVSIFSGWILFYLIFPNDEFSEFIINSLTVFSTLSWFHGIEFPTPFLSLDARSSKSILLFLFTGFFLIRLINYKKDSGSLFVLANILLFIASLLYFNYGLNRSDGGHIRNATSFIFIPFITLITFYLINKLENILNKKDYLMKYLSIFVIFLFFGSTLFIDKKFENKNVLNIFNSKSSIKKLINYDDNEYIDEDYNKLINYYQKLTTNDSCTTIFTNEVVLFYLLDKPSCSKYYFMWSSFHKNIQNNIIIDLKKEQPSFVIYKSEKDIFYNSDKVLKTLDKYFMDNYAFHEKFKYWEIYKKK
jgi:hypothetical protein